MTKMNVPKLRFKGFSVEWELDQLESVVLKKKSYPISRDYEVDESNTEYVHYGDIHIRKKGIIKYGDELPNILDGNYELLSSGDIVLADASEDYEEVAKPMLLENIKDRNVVAGLHTIALETINIDSKYLYYFMNTNTYKKSCYKLANGMKVYGISYNNLNKIVLGIPSTKEQNLIGLFLEKIDKLIELQTKKLEALKKLKQGYLQKMFPQDGDKVPRLRFKEFSGEWDSNFLRNVVDRLDNKRVPIKESEREIGEVPYYGANGIQGYIKGYTHSGENILLAEDGASDIINYPVIYTNGNIWVNNHAHVLKSIIHKSYSKFILYNLKTIKYDKYLTGTGRYKLNADTLMKINLLLPSLSEQKQIGDFIYSIDEVIMNEDKKIKLLGKQKKAYLQKLFI